MDDDLYWDFFEKLKINLQKNPSYEEVQEHINKTFFATNEEKRKINNLKIYGK